ncbi:unnamed protein product [Brassicogethes aeneus]|uniref:C2H2-type domain-containing protein n=1 Tax=Brassicogethes aeneus TaxID=1431903 RepID=A0A9P0FD21_BRAAE|nr:unnamed protein product [Brassicogethes aeneus]
MTSDFRSEDITPASSNYNTDSDDFDDDLVPLRCWDCNINFTAREYLYKHLIHHVRQPYVNIERLQLPPLKITLKTRGDNNFEIVHSPPTATPPHAAGDLDEDKAEAKLALGGLSAETQSIKEELKEPENDECETNVRFSPNFVAVPQEADSPASSPASNSGTDKDSSSSATDPIAGAETPEYGNVPGAEPTPPPEPSPDYPKIRIKTTGLLKEPQGCTITEITDDNPNGDPNIDFFAFSGQNNENNMWNAPSLEDPLKITDLNDDNNIMALFNNNDKAKDYGFCTSDSEYISLDRLGDNNRGAMQLYNPNNSVVPTSSSNNPLDSLTGLPMQALAQQVSRLQPSGSSNQLHQQNVLINIQQFPAPPQPQYQPPMYTHHPQPPMYPPYQYQPNMYYPPAPPGYPPQHMPPPMQPPPPQMAGPPGVHPHPQQPPPPRGQGSPASNQNQQLQPQGQGYRQPMPPRQPAPRQQNPGQRMSMAPRQPGMGARGPNAPRQRAPMMRPRGAAPIGPQGPRGVRPRMGVPQNGQVRPHNSPVKRTPEQMAQLQAKKKRLDLLTPDKDDDDCQVISIQPKNTDGGLPQIESVQGGTTEPAENSIMHLSDSITLSVRNPPPKPVEVVKKSDASAVANILATRGITVTATAKPKEITKSTAAPALPASLNLNGAVSILPAAKTNGNTAKSSEALPTVDLTDDTPVPSPIKQSTNSPQKQRPGLPYRCDLCPAQYPNALGLNKHRQSYHKTTGGMPELGIPLVNLKQNGIMQKLGQLGINLYIPLPSSGGDGMFGLPIINTRNPGNVSALGATQMLSLGPVRNIPKPASNNNVVNRAQHPQKP